MPGRESTSCLASSGMSPSRCITQKSLFDTELNTSWTHQKWEYILFIDESRFSTIFFTWKESGACYHSSYVRGIEQVDGRGILVWYSIMLGSRIPFLMHVVSLHSATGVRPLKPVCGFLECYRPPSSRLCMIIQGHKEFTMLKIFLKKGIFAV